MQDRYDKIFTWVLMIVFAMGLICTIYYFIDVLLTPVTNVGLFDDHPKIDLLAIILNFIVLNFACLIVLIFPATKYWKYVSVGVGVLGIIFCYLMWLDFYIGPNPYSITHSTILWTSTYPLLLWNLWGMFIPYLEKRLRKVWLYGYPAGCLLICLIALIPPPNY